MNAFDYLRRIGNQAKEIGGLSRPLSTLDTSNPPKGGSAITSQSKMKPLLLEIKVTTETKITNEDTHTKSG